MLINSSPKRHLNSLFYRGVHQSFPDKEKRYILLLNTICLAQLLVYMLSILHYLISQNLNNHVIIYSSVSSVFLLFIFFLNSNRYYLLARHLFATYLIMGILYTNVWFGMPALIYFIAIIYPPVIFRQKQTIIRYFVVFSILFTIVIYLQYQIDPFHGLTENELLSATYSQVFITYFLSTFIFIYVLKYQNIKYESSIENRKKKLHVENTQKTIQLTQKTADVSDTGKLLICLKEGLKNFLEEEPNNLKVSRLLNEIRLFDQENTWREFQVYFNHIHPDFYNKLKAAIPDLSQHELRMCALIYMKMNTRDIEELTHKSTNNIEVAKTRIRNKMKLTSGETIEQRLSQIIIETE